MISYILIVMFSDLDETKVSELSNNSFQMKLKLSH
jgi:hypothetical protein